MQQHKEESKNSQSKSDQQARENYGNEIVKREKVDDSPLEIITIDNGSFAAIGNRRITEIEDYETIKGKIIGHDYNIIIALIVAIAERCSEIEIMTTTIQREETKESVIKNT